MTGLNHLYSLSSVCQFHFPNTHEQVLTLLFLGKHFLDYLLSFNLPTFLATEIVTRVSINHYSRLHSVRYDSAKHLYIGFNLFLSESSQLEFLILQRPKLI